MNRSDYEINWARGFDKLIGKDTIQRIISNDDVKIKLITNTHELNECLTEKKEYNSDMYSEESLPLLRNQVDCIVALSKNEIKLGYRESIGSEIVKSIEPSFDRESIIFVKNLVAVATGAGHPESCGGMGWKLEVYYYDPSFSK